MKLFRVEIALAILIPQVLFAQNMSVKRWENSVINLECNLYKCGDTTQYKSRAFLLAKGAHLELGRGILKGTALLISDGKKKYLVTAKHIVSTKILITNLPSNI